MSFILPETELMKIKNESKEPFKATFIFEPLAPGYGLTLGHALRRVLLSSLSGAAIYNVKIEGVTHEFSTLKNVKEDVIEIILNLKSLRVKLIGDESAVLKLSKKGPGVVTASDFSKNSQVEIIDPTHHIATLDKKGNLNIEVTIKKGTGYEPVEARKDEKLPLGTIALDSIFTPIKRIHYSVENTRVGDRTDFDKLTLNITTDGSIEPDIALKNACQILLDHFNIIFSAEFKPAVKAKAAKKVKTAKPTLKKERAPKKVKKAKKK
ncbi:MAG: DNA-directed RNA polymerase subunit alpha [Patescibacteria group bacterium]|nr:DNA-directed RNA polymerase subunit alpha [Patescibacteria group bacterium]